MEPRSSAADRHRFQLAHHASDRTPRAVVGAAVARLIDGPERASDETSPERLVRFEIPLPEGTFLTDGLSLSPDGNTLAFAAQEEETLTSICVRSLDALETRRLDGTDGARFPFWSRDGRELAYFAGGALQVLDLVGRTSRRVATTGGFSNVRGGSRGADDTIVYAPAHFGALLGADAKGGESESESEPKLATRLDEAEGDGTHRVPVFLPDGRRFLFFAAPASGTEPGPIRMGELGSSESRAITDSSSMAVFVAPDILV